MMAMWIFKHWRRTGRYKDEVKGEETSKLFPYEQISAPAGEALCSWLYVDNCAP